ncbi:Ig-like domain-containing protein, partial [Photobacterium damselae]
INSATGVITLSPTETDVGQLSLTVQVSDGELTHETPLTVTVPEPVNTAPVISALPPTEAIIGETTTVQVVANDADDDTLTYALLNGPAWASINSGTGMITLSPTETDVGQLSLTVQVSDGELTHEETLSITVPEPPFKPIIQPWIYDDGLDYISENVISLEPNHIKPIEVVYVTKIQSEPVQSLNQNGKVVYKFNDVVFEKISSHEFNLINKTPMK